MTKTELLELAKRHYIFDASLSKAEIVRGIQRSEGAIDCYGNGAGCAREECRWRADCRLEHDGPGIEFPAFPPSPTGAW